MTTEQFAQLGILSKVRTYVGGREHVARVMQKRHKEEQLLLQFHLAHGETVYHWYHRQQVHLCDQGASVGPTERRITLATLAEWMGLDSTMEARR